MLTLWRPLGEDGLGGVTWSAPESHACRSARVQRRFTDRNGDDAVSSAVTYTRASISDDEVLRGVRVLLGVVSTQATPPREARDIRDLSENESGAGDLKKLWFA